MIELKAYHMKAPSETFENIYTKRLNRAKIFCRNRIIQYDVEIRNTKDVTTTVAKSNELLTNICRRARANHLCSLTLGEIQTLIETLQSKHDIIQNIQIKQRKPRDNSGIESIVQQSITLSDYSYSDLRQGLKELQSLIGSMGRNQNKIANHLDYINFDSLTQLTILNLKNHLRLYDTILDILMNTNYKKLTDLIPIEKLKIELQNIQRQAAEEGCIIPINLYYLNMAQLLLISNISAKRMGNHLMIKITVPTVYQSEFELLEAIPIPFEYNNSSYELTPITQFCLIYIDKTKEFQDVYYSALNLEDKNRCIDLPEGI